MESIPATALRHARDAAVKECIALRPLQEKARTDEVRAEREASNARVEHRRITDLVGDQLTAISELQDAYKKLTGIGMANASPSNY